ncbi:MAG: hypothetical protein Q8N37_04270 [bacterium]|nr:hypothetical protein [bacterium]
MPKESKGKQYEKEVKTAMFSLDNFMCPDGQWYSIDELYDIMYQVYKKEIYSKAVIEEAIKRSRSDKLLYAKIKDGVLYYRHKEYHHNKNY